jgi:hypothetical protein
MKRSVIIASYYSTLYARAMSEAKKREGNSRKRSGFGSFIRTEFALIVGVLTAAIFLSAGDRLTESLGHPAATG